MCLAASAAGTAEAKTPRRECAGQSFHNTERHARAEPNAVVGDDDNAPLDDEHPVRLRDEIERQWDRNEQQRGGATGLAGIASGLAGNASGPAGSATGPAGSATEPAGSASGPAGSATENGSTGRGSFAH